MPVPVVHRRLTSPALHNTPLACLYCVWRGTATSTAPTAQQRCLSLQQVLHTRITLEDEQHLVHSADMEKKIAHRQAIARRLALSLARSEQNSVAAITEVDSENHSH
ncbi:hypothetical protein C2E23DRAFT_861944 [Lenzites betulinus]|nr:hypothetical protein C2E23DRAFT_861944 [Lenzites betulinus]